MLLEKDGEDQLEQPCEKLRIITWNQGGEKYSTRNKKEDATLVVFVTPCVEFAFSDTSLKKNCRREDEEEDVSSYLWT